MPNGHTLRIRTFVLGPTDCHGLVVLITPEDVAFKKNKDEKHSRLSHLKNNVSTNSLVSCRGRVVVIVCACPTLSTRMAQLEKLNYFLRFRHAFEVVSGNVLFTLCTCICVRYTYSVIREKNASSLLLWRKQTPVKIKQRIQNSNSINCKPLLYKNKKNRQRSKNLICEKPCLLETNVS